MTSINGPLPLSLVATTRMLEIVDEGYPLKGRCDNFKSFIKNALEAPLVFIDSAFFSGNVFIQVLKTPFVSKDQDGNPISKRKWFVVSLSILLIDVPFSWLHEFVHCIVKISTFALGMISPNAVLFGVKLNYNFNKAMHLLKHHIHLCRGSYTPSFTRCVTVKRSVFLEEQINEIFDSSWKASREAALKPKIAQKIHDYLRSFSQQKIQDGINKLEPSLKAQIEGGNKVIELNDLSAEELNKFFDVFVEGNLTLRREIEADFNHLFLRGTFRMWSKDFSSFSVRHCVRVISNRLC